MLPTIKLSDIAEKWRQALCNSAEVEGFCQSHYGKLLKVYVGINAKKMPTKDDCPYVIIWPGNKTEGAGEPEYHYMLSIGWAIHNATEQIIDNSVIRPGYNETDELGQLMIKALAEINENYPFSTIDYDINANEFFPQFPGLAHITITVPVTFGYDLIY